MSTDEGSGLSTSGRSTPDSPAEYIEDSQNSSHDDRASNPSTQERVLKQGPWDQVRTEAMLKGAPSLPMPVKIATPDSLIGCFNHLRLNAGILPVGGDRFAPVTGEEPYYDVPYLEYEKGVIYADRRLDLCKMVLGPLNIDALMDSLERNTFIEHFLLGNNIIGPAGARRIARFIKDNPERMDTWYLAGNCIDTAGLQGIIKAIVDSNSIASNIWLKRNPLGQASAANLARLIIHSEHLDTLDLDQTELGDKGVTELFNALGGALNSGKTLRLRHIYLNAVGIGLKASTAIGGFLASPRCQLESLFISNNPIGDAGAAELASGLAQNQTLLRFMAASTGLTSSGANAILNALVEHRRIIALDIGQSFATADLGSRHNYIDDDACDALIKFLETTSTLRYLAIDHLAISQPTMNQVYQALIACKTLCWVKASTVTATQGGNDVVKARLVAKKLLPLVREQLTINVSELYDGSEYAQFEAEEKRWLASPRESVRKIDSVYRNRDAGLARRGLLKLEKYWEEGDGTLEQVMAS